jgi:quercetin dioxygenase-like cupin family protein
MQITRNTTETATGPSEWFTGAVYIDTVATPTETSRLGAASVHFTPGARTGEIEVIRPGDRVFFEPGEDHWHGAALGRFMTHIAMQEADDSGSPVAWGEHVTDEEYGAAPAIER